MLSNYIIIQHRWNKEEEHPHTAPRRCSTHTRSHTPTAPLPAGNLSRVRMDARFPGRGFTAHGQRVERETQQGGETRQQLD